MRNKHGFSPPTILPKQFGKQARIPAPTYSSVILQRLRICQAKQNQRHAGQTCFPSSSPFHAREDKRFRALYWTSTIQNRNQEATVSLKTGCQLYCLPISQPPPPLLAVHTQLQDFPHVQQRFTAASSYLHNVDKVIFSEGVQDRLDRILHQLQGLSMGASTPVNNVSSIL